MVHRYAMVLYVSDIYTLADALSTHARVDLPKKRLESKGSTEVDSSYTSARF